LFHAKHSPDGEKEIFKRRPEVEWLPMFNIFEELLLSIKLIGLKSALPEA